MQEESSQEEEGRGGRGKDEGRREFKGSYSLITRHYNKMDQLITTTNLYTFLSFNFICFIAS